MAPSAEEWRLLSVIAAMQQQGIPIATSEDLISSMRRKEKGLQELLKLSTAK